MPLYQALNEADKKTQEEAAQAVLVAKQVGVQVRVLSCPIAIDPVCNAACPFAIRHAPFHSNCPIAMRHVSEKCEAPMNVARDM